MKNTKIIIIIISIITLVGCSKLDIASQDYTVLNNLKNGNNVVTETNCESYTVKDNYLEKEPSKSINWELIELSNAKMWFDKNLNLESRIKIVEESIDIINLISSIYDNDKKFEYYISDTVYNYNENDRIYIKYSDYNLDLCEITIRTLYSIFGDTSHYGLLYGEAIDLLKDADKYNSDLSHIDINYQGNSDEFDSNTVKSILEKNNEIMDLTLPIFSSDNYCIYNINYMKDFSVSFVEYLKENYGQEKFVEFLESSSRFSLEFDNQYTKYMNEWLKHKGINIKKNFETFPIRFKIYGDKYFPIAICTEWMQYCIEPGFYDFCTQYYTPNSSQKYLDNSYASVLSYIKLLEQKMSASRKLFCKNLTSEDSKNFITYFVNDTKLIRYDVMMSYCDYLVETICCCNYNTYIHEYVHLITMSKDYKYTFNYILVEGIATYGQILNSRLYQFTLESFYNKEWYIFTQELNEQFDTYLTSRGLGTLKDNINNIDVLFEYYEFYCYNEYLNKKNEMYNDQFYYHYKFGPVFCKYLIDNHGYDKYIQAMNVEKNFYRTYGMSIEDKQNEFINYLSNKFDKYVSK